MLSRLRTMLLGPAKDPGTLFVKTVKTTSLHAAYDSPKFYEAWRTVIQRYGGNITPSEFAVKMAMENSRIRPD